MEILNVGIGEMLLILIIALLVFGPERLPEVARQAARLLNQLRGAADEVQRIFTEETRSLREPLEETKREIESVARPFEETRREIESVARPLDTARRDVERVARGLNGALDEATSPPQAETDAPPEAPDVPTYKPLSRAEASDDDA